MKFGVVGVGYLGRFHAQKYFALAPTEFVGVLDSNLVAAEAVAKETSSKVFSDLKDFCKNIDAASIATSTKGHFEVAKFLLENGKSVLVEKPITETVAQAEELCHLAQKNGALLQVGHIERFNPVFVEGLKHIQSPRFIEARRAAPLRSRGADVDVVLDLMIHDIDLVTSIVRSPVVVDQVWGCSVVSEQLDQVRARLKFANGVVADILADRTSPVVERTFRVTQAGSHLFMDLGNLKISKSEFLGRFPKSVEPVKSSEISIEKSDALQNEVASFISAVKGKHPVAVSGQEGLQALVLATEISQRAHAK
jgi:predicted dehydrogenase